MHYLHHWRKLMQIRCQKGSGTKMRRCLVGDSISIVKILSLLILRKKNFKVEKLGLKKRNSDMQ